MSLMVIMIHDSNLISNAPLDFWEGGVLRGSRGVFSKLWDFVKPSQCGLFFSFTIFFWETFFFFSFYENQNFIFLHSVRTLLFFTKLWRNIFLHNSEKKSSSQNIFRYFEKILLGKISSIFSKNTISRAGNGIHLLYFTF